jgi:hypothetical protein
MKIDHSSSEKPDFSETVALAVARLRQQLQHDCERAYPDLRDTIPFILDQEEKHAWELSSFPHLLLPSLVEAHIANLCVRLDLRRQKEKNASSAWPKRDAHSAGEF